MLPSHLFCCGAVAALVFRLPVHVTVKPLLRAAKVARSVECCVAKEVAESVLHRVALRGCRLCK